MERVINIIAFLLGIFLIYKSYRLVKSKREDLFDFFLWTFIGIGLVITSVYLDIVNYVLGFMNMTSRVNFLFSFSALLSLFLIFMLFKEIRNLEKKQSRLNEVISIIKYEKIKDYNVKRSNRHK